MRIAFANTKDRRWYVEGGSTSWGFGFDVSHFADNEEDGFAPAGWVLSIQVGPWSIDLMSEAGARSMLGDSLQHYGKAWVA